jgi:hypothetical protein
MSKIDHSKVYAMEHPEARNCDTQEQLDAVTNV